MPAVEFRVYDRTNTTHLTTLAGTTRDVHSRQCQDVENDTGTAGVTLDIANPDLAHMVEGNIVRCYVDGVAAYSWVVGPMDQDTVTAEEEAGEERRISGRGTLGLWADAIVYPETRATSIGQVWPPLDERRVVDVRRFDFSAVGYDDSAWTPAVVVPPPPALAPLAGTPSGWPLESQDWVWSRAPVNGAQPAGHSYFRHAFSTAAATKASVYITADNGFEVFLDGEMLLSELRTPVLWTTSRSVQVDLTASTHFLAVKAVNHEHTGPPHPAGLAVVVVALDDNGDPASVLTSTGATGWKCADYPAEPPGETVGMIMFKLWQDAQIRGAIPDLTLGFTTTHDSAGTPWPNAPDVALSVGDDYLQVLRKLSELYCDVAMDPASLRLDAWVSRGTDRSGSVSFEVGANITALSHKGGEQARTSAILGRFGDHWLERTGTGRRQEKFLELGTATSSAQAQRMVDAALAERDLPIVTTTTGWEPTAGTVPWVHFKVGDRVSAPDASRVMVGGRRVKSISLAETDDDYEFVAELGSVESDAIDRLQRLARKAGHGALDGNFANATSSAGADVMADINGAKVTTSVPDIPLNALTDVVSVPSAPPALGDFMGFNPDLGTNGMWEPQPADFIGAGAPGTFLVTDDLGVDHRWTEPDEMAITSGRVLIRSAAPLQALFKSTGANRAAIAIDNEAGGQQSTIDFLDAGVTEYQIGKQADNGFFLWTGPPHNTDVMRVQPNNGGVLKMSFWPTRLGTVGISVADPYYDYRLHCIGTIGVFNASFSDRPAPNGVEIRDERVYGDLDLPGIIFHKNNRQPGGSHLDAIYQFRYSTVFPTWDRLKFVGPAPANGQGQAVIENIGLADGTAMVHIYNDLDVNGAYSDTAADSRYTLVWVTYGDMKANNFITFSDPALKSSIRGAGPALATLRKMPERKEWDWKGGRQDKATGYLAPDVATAVPELAHYDADGRPTGWKVVDAVAMTIAGMQELTDRLEALEARK